MGALGRRIGDGWVALAVALTLLLALAGPAARAGDGLPEILSPADAARYERIFALQERGAWKAADRLIAKLSDPLLMGHVRAQRYLHPTRYRSHFRELADWLRTYADHPEAVRLYKLALRRRPKGAAMPRPPASPRQPPLAGPPALATLPPPPPRPRLSEAAEHELARLVRHIRRHLRKGDVRGAAKHLAKGRFPVLADARLFDVTRARVAHAFLVAGDDARALALARASAARTPVPLAEWTIGLAAYRAGDLETSRAAFERLVAQRRGGADDSLAAAAFWAARLALKTRRPERVSAYLRIAAAVPRCFHGLLARRALGTDWTGHAFAPPVLSAAELAALDAVPAARRALALVQVGRRDLAAAEVRRLDPRRGPALAKAMAVVAANLASPAAQLRLARRLAAAGAVGHAAALYPLMPWRPAGGYRVDRALVHAVVRKESRYRARARSGAGARGLMQLMPRTAAFVAGERVARKRLYDPAVNLDLGQRYILHLLDQPVVGGDLVKLLAAYNGGPAKLGAWLRRGAFADDPLLFIEALPSPETRSFVEQVLTALWLYRARLGQPAPSLDALAGGDWPAYVSLDAASRIADARN